MAVRIDVAQQGPAAIRRVIGLRSGGVTAGTLCRQSLARGGTLDIGSRE